jgi:hypothetical protein
MQEDVTSLTKDMIRSEINALNQTDPWTLEEYEYSRKLIAELDKRMEDDVMMDNGGMLEYSDCLNPSGHTKKEGKP